MGLKPQIFRENRGESLAGKSGLFGANWGLFRAYRGLFGANSSAPHSHGGRAEIGPKGPFLAHLARFGPSPRLLSPCLDFPDAIAAFSDCKFKITTLTASWRVPRLAGSGRFPSEFRANSERTTSSEQNPDKFRASVPNPLFPRHSVQRISVIG